MARKVDPNKLSINELRRLLIEKQRSGRHERIERYRETGRVVRLVSDEDETTWEDIRTSSPLGEGPPDPKEEENARKFLNLLINLARLPETLTEVHVGNFHSVVEKAPSADLNIFGMDADLKFEFVEEMSQKTQSSCLFVKDSGHESILA